MSLSRNAAYTMTSSVMQIGVTLVTIPIYLSVIGLERYGALVVIWLVLDYVLIFNLSLDRAAANFMSRNIGDKLRTSQLFWTAIAICGATGIIGALVVYNYLGPFIIRYLSVSADMLAEVHYGYAALAVTLLINIIGTILASLLQSQERFLALNVSQFTMSLLFQVAPVTAATLISPSLETVLLAGCAARNVQTLLYLYFAFSAAHRPLKPEFSRLDGLEMLKYGAWASVTGVISPLVFNMDRMAISSLLGSAAVALFSLPYNLVMKAQLLPGSLATVLFPRLSQSSDVEQRLSTASDALVSLAIILAPGLVVGSFLLEPFMTLWIHKFVSKETVVVGQILIVGIWFNALAIIPYIWLQAKGRPDIVAKVHTAEIAPFIIVLWLMVQHFGIIGAAVAWTLRATADSLVLFVLSRLSASVVQRLLFPFACVVAAVVVTSAFTLSGTLTIVLGLVLLAALLVWSIRSAPDSLKVVAAPLLGFFRRRQSLNG